MKLWKMLKIFNGPRKRKYSSSEYFVYHNEEKIEKVYGLSYKLHHDIYKRMRQIKTPQYETFYILRNKKAFNTILFAQNVDVVVTTKEGVILDTLIDLKPGYISDFYEEGNKVFFMAVGTINHYNIKVKDSFTLGYNWLKERSYYEG